MSEKSLPWDDLRTVLAVARAGALSGAAVRLGVSHATAYRRLGEIERRLGVALFDRARDGYTPTPAGEEVAAAAARVEDEVLGVARRVAGRDLRPSGTVRVTTTDTLLDGLLSPIFADLRTRHPGIALEIAVSNNVLNLTRREADLAVRPTASPPEGLVGRHIATIAQAVYGRADAVPRTPDGAADTAAASWVGPDENMAVRSLETWMAARGHDAACGYRVDTVQGMQAAARDGIGLAVLPCYIGDADARLVRLDGPIPELAADLWLLTHPDLRHAARIRAVMDGLAEAIARARPRLRGEPDG